MKRFTGFTLAEILVTLSIIGIVAAIMIPSLLVNVNDKAYDAQSRSLHARMAQSLGQLSDIKSYKTAQNFVTKALNRVYKISTVCEEGNLGACDIPQTIQTFGNDSYTIWGSTPSSGGSVSTAGFRTVNGESILIKYDPRCTDKHGSNAVGVFDEVCVNMLYDLNGASKTPNQIGKDIGIISVLWPSSPTVVTPRPQSENIEGTHAYYSSNTEAATLCKNAGDYRLPDREQLIAMLYNYSIYANGAAPSNNKFWSSSIAEGDTVWQIALDGTQYKAQASESATIRCVVK